MLSGTDAGPAALPYRGEGSDRGRVGVRIVGRGLAGPRRTTTPLTADISNEDEPA